MRVFQLAAGSYGHIEAGLRAGVGLAGLALTLLVMLLAQAGELT